MKARITEKEEGEIREKCMNSSKARIVKDDEYKKKDYLLGKVSLKEARNILHTRMNMNRIPGNYKGKSEGTCPLCTKAKGNAEHYFQCHKVRTLREVWEVKEDLRSNEIEKMKDVSSFLEKVELIVNPEQMRGEWKEQWRVGVTAENQRSIGGAVEIEELAENQRSSGESEERCRIEEGCVELNEL